MEKIAVTKLRRLINYNPKTGKMTWKSRPLSMFDYPSKYSAERRQSSWNARYAGKPVGGDNGGGYLATFILKKGYKVHQIAFALANGRWPVAVVDHIDGDRSNNAANNLREVTPSGNARNTERHRSGDAGVVFYKPLGKWRAQIWSKGRDISLGYFDSRADARLARREGEKLHWGIR